MTSSAFVQAHLQSRVSGRVIVYLTDDRHFTHFSTDDDGESAFNLCVQGLANKDHCFYVLSTSSRVKTTHIRALWQEAQEFSMVIVVAKRNPEQGSGFPFPGGSLAGLLTTLEARTA
jgi:phosphoheptose isomerase